jgi:hypothetical protein
MLGLVIEVGIRTSVWVITSSCRVIYRLCFGTPEDRLEQRIRVLEARIHELEDKSVSAFA